MKSIQPKEHRVVMLLILPFELPLMIEQVLPYQVNQDGELVNRINNMPVPTMLPP